MSDDPGDLCTFVLVIYPSGKAAIVQNQLSNADVVRHLKFVAGYVDSLPEELGAIFPSEVP